MKKLTIILGLVFVMLFSMFLMADAIKIAPYSQPLHDIMHWDRTSSKLIIMNPEGERQTVAWASTVDLWNYNGNVWTFDLPSGDKFAFSKRVDFNVSTTEGAGSTIRGVSVTDTVGAAGGIHEGVYSLVTSAFATGSWTNAVVGVITYSAAGSASGGLAAALCGEINMQPAASSGGSYYNVHSYFSVPTAAELIDSTAFNYAFERYELSDNASFDFNLYGLLWHIVGFTDATTKVWYDNTLKIQIDTTKWWIPLSEAEGSYTTAYPIVSTYLAGTQVSLSGTLAEAVSGRGIKSSHTVNVANFGDGYGKDEFELTTTGTVAGHVACASFWVNTATGVTGTGGSFLTPLSLGIWEDAAASMANTTVILGARIQGVLGDTDNDNLAVFSLACSGDTLDALWSISDPTQASYATDDTTDSAKLGAMPFMTSSTGEVYWIRLWEDGS